MPTRVTQQVKVQVVDVDSAKHGGNMRVTQVTRVVIGTIGLGSPGGLARMGFGQ